MNKNSRVIIGGCFLNYSGISNQALALSTSGTIMRNGYNKLLNSNSATIFIFLYGIMIQIVSFPVIYIYGAALQDALPESVEIIDKFIFLWFFVLIVAVFSILIASMQIRERKRKPEKLKTPLIGLILNSGWLICYLVLIYFVFVVKMPNLFM